MRNPDAVGNLFESRDRKDKKYNAGGKLIESKTAFYSYDEEGFLIEKKEKSGKVWKYEWNTAGMLQRVVRPDKAEVHFKYDALGRRLEKQYKKTITRFIWDGSKPLHEWKEFDAKDATADEIITWVFNEDDFAPTAKIKGEKKYSIVTDHLGTPVQGYNETGELIWDRELDSYGKIRMLKGDEGFCNYLYQGQTLDGETGLAYNRFRYYDSEIGTYISQDPIGLVSGQSNFHAYVHDTNTWIDPLGLASYNKNIKDLREGPNGTVVEVKSKRDAHQLLMDAFPDAIKVRGIGSQDAQGIRKKHKMEQFDKVYVDGKPRYRKDYPINKETGRVYGHDDPKGTGHGENPHINIKRADGTMVRIDIVK